MKDPAQSQPEPVLGGHAINPFAEGDSWAWPNRWPNNWPGGVMPGAQQLSAVMPEAWVLADSDDKPVHVAQVIAEFNALVDDTIIQHQAAINDWIEAMLRRHLSEQLIKVLELTKSAQLADSTDLHVRIAHEQPYTGEWLRTRATVLRGVVVLEDQIFIVRTEDDPAKAASRPWGPPGA